MKNLIPICLLLTACAADDISSDVKLTLIETDEGICVPVDCSLANWQNDPDYQIVFSDGTLFDCKGDMPPCHGFESEHAPIYECRPCGDK